MGKRLQNEQGAAMLMVLLVVLVLMGSAGFFLSHISNASTQVNITEKRVGAQLVSQAGIDYYSERVREEIASQDGQRELLADVRFPIVTTMTVTLDENNRFEIKDVTTSTTGNVKTITFTSVGTSHDKTKEQTKTMTVTAN